MTYTDTELTASLKECVSKLFLMFKRLFSDFIISVSIWTGQKSRDEVIDSHEFPATHHPAAGIITVTTPEVLSEFIQWT